MLFLCSLPTGMHLAVALACGSLVFAAGLFAGLYFAKRIDEDAARLTNLELGP